LGIVVGLQDVLLSVSLVLGPGVSSNLLRLLVCLLLIGRLLVGRPLWLLWLLLEGLLPEGGLLVGWLDGLLGSWLVVSLLSSGLLLLLVSRGRPLLLNLLEVLEAALLRSSCWLLLLSHSDHLSGGLWQRVGSWLLESLLGSLLSLP